MRSKGSLPSSYIPVLWQMDPVHSLQSYFFMIHSNIILSSTPRSSKRPLSFTFPHQNSVCTSQGRSTSRCDPLQQTEMIWISRCQKNDDYSHFTNFKLEKNLHTFNYGNFSVRSRQLQNRTIIDISETCKGTDVSVARTRYCARSRCQ